MQLDIVILNKTRSTHKTKHYIFHTCGFWITHVHIKRICLYIKKRSEVEKKEPGGKLEKKEVAREAMITVHVMFE